MKNLINTHDMTISSFKLSKNGLEAIGSPTFDDWSKCGEFLKNANGAVHFWIGDWLNYGETKWGDTYTQAIDETGYDYQTLSNDKWVSKRIDRSRRRNNLSFSHHQEVADLTPEEQEEMLNIAQDQSLSRNDFRKVIRNYKLRMDLPELTDQQIQGSEEDFEKATELVIKLIELTDEMKLVNFTSWNEDAKDYLFSQVKKTVGYMGSLIQRR